MTTNGRAARKPRDRTNSQTISEDDILSLLADKARELTAIRTTARKYPTLRKILSEAVENLPADTRLPGIRRLSECLGISLVTTQRALADLAHDGVLYSKPRAGVFVGSQSRGSSDGQHARRADASQSSVSRHPFQTSFDFATDSAAPYQQRFWNTLAGLFAKQFPNASPVLHFGNDAFRNDLPIDVCERYPWKPIHENDVDSLLDLANFAGSLLPVAPTGGGLLPIYHRTYFLFYNQTLLERMNLPLPSYRTFEGQSDYIKELGIKLVSRGYDPHPYSIQEPVTLVGGWAARFSHLLEAEEDDMEIRSEVISATERLLGFCRLCRYSVPRRDDWIATYNDFLRGEVPFFLGYSVDYWELSQKKLPFSLGAYPTLCCDDSLFLWTRVGAIANRSEHPVESLNFLLFLLRPEVQRHFAETGSFGASNAEDFHPKTSADPEWVKQTLSRSVPFHIATRERFYLAINIFGSEIWRGLLEGVSAKDVVDRALQLGRAYLQHCSQGMNAGSGVKKSR